MRRSGSGPTRATRLRTPAAARAPGSQARPPGPATEAAHGACAQIGHSAWRVGDSVDADYCFNIFDIGESIFLKSFGISNVEAGIALVFTSVASDELSICIGPIDIVVEVASGKPFIFFISSNIADIRLNIGFARSMPVSALKNCSAL